MFSEIEGLQNKEEWEEEIIGIYSLWITAIDEEDTKIGSEINDKARKTIF